jgi:hypothetical protein
MGWINQLEVQFWPNKEYYMGAVMKAPKQPEFLGNVFGNAN